MSAAAVAGFARRAARGGGGGDGCNSEWLGWRWEMGRTAVCGASVAWGVGDAMAATRVRRVVRAPRRESSRRTWGGDGYELSGGVNVSGTWGSGAIE